LREALGKGENKQKREKIEALKYAKLGEGGGKGSGEGEIFSITDLAD